MASSGIRSPRTCRSRRSASRRVSSRSAGASSSSPAKAALLSSPERPAPASRSPCAFSAERLSAQRDVKVGVISRPQAGLADFYREMGELFGVVLHPHNRWGGAKVLRERWQTHIDAAFSRPVLIVDEAQEMLPAVLSELRLLCLGAARFPHPAHGRAGRRRTPHRALAIRRVPPARQPHAGAPGARPRHAR